MNRQTLTTLLTDLKNGTLSLEETVNRLSTFPAETLEDACLDHQRTLRTGIPEVIFGAGKTPEQIISIASAFLRQNTILLATRVNEDKAAKVTKALPSLTYHRDAHILTCNEQNESPASYRGYTAVVSAGTSDIPVAEEARITLSTLGHPVETLYDAGVAGLHRLFNRRTLLNDAAVIIVAAGMEGALPSVIGGLVSCPVIAVPTSVGYGASFGGIAALLGMLNSCAPGVAVVNIDNGFGAACMAEAINRIKKPA
ncbi:nickel pincer cofactor biosynthesis protein LarB [Desulfomarina sp.]